MNDIVIRTVNLTKAYRLYARPQDRFLDMLGLLPAKRPYSEHVALKRVSVEITRGEKVAIIGRNGAGKSTLLKLISKVIEPSSGEIHVGGAVRALLQIGSGFHPEFTGRENVYGYLAYLGVTGKEADRRFSEIVEFSELEEYVNQPLKTYSTGMAVRLMFATSTAVAPEVLVLDEVLSVGDAYFSHKSFERINELSEREGTTLLLVSHDIYSAAKLCPRVIWLDDGEILIDGAGASVVKAYEDSIREQEENRLRKRKQSRLEEIARSSAHSPKQIMVEFRSRNNAPLPCPVYFSRIELKTARNIVASLPLAEHVQMEDASHIETKASNWGDVIEWRGRTVRPMLNFGGAFHKSAGVFSVPSTGFSASNLELLVEAWVDASCDVLVRAFHQGEQFDLGVLDLVPGAWSQQGIKWSIEQSSGATAASTFLQDVSLSGVHGSGRIGIVNVIVLNDRGEEAHVFGHGLPVRFQISYTVRDRAFEGKAQVLLALHCDGIQDVCRFITRDLRFVGSEPDGVIELFLPKFNLANGTYTVTVMIAKEGYFDQDQVLFYSINPDVYASVGRIVEIQVVNGGVVGTGTAVVGEGLWSIRAERLVDQSARESNV